jgi:hypothetical protein
VRDLAILFRVPPHYLGHRVAPETREDAARERLAHWRQMPVAPPWDGSDPDLETVMYADAIWSMAMPESKELAEELLAPLQEKVS